MFQTMTKKGAITVQVVLHRVTDAVVKCTAYCEVLQHKQRRLFPEEGFPQQQFLCGGCGKNGGRGMWRSAALLSSAA